MSHKTVALLPIKANSDRIKEKNFKDFNGKPLFQWVLNTLLETVEIDLIVINTDARHILEDKGIYDTNRILIRDRKPEICGDSVSMNSVIADDLHNIDADLFLMTHTTNPLLSSTTILNALTIFHSAQTTDSADSLFSVNKVQGRFYGESGNAINHDPENLIRTQDLEPWYEENSNLYLFTQDSFTKAGGRIGRNPLMYVTPKLESIDIDTQEDWYFALALANHAPTR